MYKLIWIDEGDEQKVQHEINDVLAFDSISIDDVNNVLEGMEKDYKLSDEEVDEISYLIDKRDDFPNITELRDIIQTVIGRS